MSSSSSSNSGFQNTTIAFVGCHLASDKGGKSKIAKRVTDTRKMLEGLELAYDTLGFELQLSCHHVVLLGDVPPERIAATEEGRRRWLQMLVDFVEFGGGVGFLFGDAAMPERYRNTLLQDLLPVVLEDPTWLANNRPSREDEFRPVLENPLNPHEILLLQRDPAFNRRLWEQGLPGFYVYHPVQRAKPGATVLLHHPTDRNAYGNRPIAVTAP